MNEQLLSLLESMKRMPKTENWNESHAQELICFGGELYDKYHFQLRRKIDDAGQH